MHSNYNVKNRYLFRRAICEDIARFYYKNRKLPILTYKGLGLKKSLMRNVGQGVFTFHKIRKGDILEINKCISAPNVDNMHCYRDKDQQAYISSGLASFYNTSYKPKDSNADYLFIKHINNFYDVNLVIVYAIKDISAGEEILYDYDIRNPKKNTVKELLNYSYPDITVDGPTILPPHRMALGS